eukprot:TRINITY_DN4205_c0_g3_i1.p1 TRINITY_DN4205_c0_g3~~TRINITY_DN4205_c0_g3_i1.p1  ORF type:complete len:1087 (+),score=361.03 TRINITY_DN4205_c0_g3_i1:94-3354(+)
MIKSGGLRLRQARRARAVGPLAQCQHYIRRAGSQTAFIVLVMVLASLTESVGAIAYNNTVVFGNKLMNYGPDAIFGDTLGNLTDEESGVANYTHLGFETGEDLDESNPNYNERRWKFDWGVDMVVRYEKGYTFCPSYVLFPAENVWPLGLRAFLYVFCLFYLFLGVAIVSDVFMGSIEEITAEKQKIVIVEEAGEQKEVAVTYTVWNETVANLTLLALGSSAPEILLAVVETVTTLDQVPGELGPSTIVGSAAFNLLCITGICMVAVEEVKKIDEFGVFLITSATSLFAYIWMLVCLQYNTPDVVDIWEGILTLVFFPLMVITAWMQDRGMFAALVGKKTDNEEDEEAKAEADAPAEPSQPSVDFTNFGDDEERARKAKDGAAPPAPPGQPVASSSSATANGDSAQPESAGKGGASPPPADNHATSPPAPVPSPPSELISEGSDQTTPKTKPLLAPGHDNPRRKSSHRLLEAKVVGGSRADIQSIIENAKANRGKVTEEAVREEIERQKEPKKMNKGHYRMNAIRSAITKQRQIVAAMSRRKSVADEELPSMSPPGSPKPNLGQSIGPGTSGYENGYVEWSKPSCSVMENRGSVTVRARRRGGTRGNLSVRYRAADLTATAGVNYAATDGLLTWVDGETGEKEVVVEIIDNEVFQPDLIFTVKLETVQGDAASQVGQNRMTVVTIVDDDHPGVFAFSSSYYLVSEMSKEVAVEILRHQGSSGSLIVSYKTLDGNGLGAAEAHRDYTPMSGQLQFKPGETSKTLFIPVVDRSLVDREDHFFVSLTEVEGKPGGKIGKVPRARVIIHSDGEAIDLVEEVLKKVKESEESDNAWVQQFRDALDWGPGDDGESPSNIEYVMHFLTLFWKVLFSFVPPPTYFGGFPCFAISLLFIGLVTAMVAEIAGLVGCTMGLKDQVTAITFVALGTSLPDTFASKQAVEEEEYADAAIGNVTGSNSVNVFLGLGLPWTLASIYYVAKGECYIVPSGALSFSVLLFTVLAVILLACLFALRASQGGELGGKNRKPFAVFFVSLWFIYILFSSLNVYGHLGKFPGTENRCPCSCSNRGILPWAREPAHVEGSCIAAGCPI